MVMRRTSRTLRMGSFKIWRFPGAVRYGRLQCTCHALLAALLRTEWLAVGGSAMGNGSTTIEKRWLVGKPCLERLHSLIEVRLDLHLHVHVPQPSTPSRGDQAALMVVFPSALAALDTHRESSAVVGHVLAFLSNLACAPANKV